MNTMNLHHIDSVKIQRKVIESDGREHSDDDLITLDITLTDNNGIQFQITCFHEFDDGEIQIKL